MNKRIIKEVANLRDDPLDNITTWIDDNDFTIIHAGIYKFDFIVNLLWRYHGP